MGKLNYKKQLLLAGVLFTLHNIEEGAGFTRFIYPTGLNLPLPDRDSMLASISAITLIAWLAILWAISKKNDTNKKYLLTTLMTVFITNAFFPHITGAIILKRYFPAVISSVILYLPYSIWLLPKLRQSYPATKQFILVSLTGLIITAAITAALQLITRFIV